MAGSELTPGPRIRIGAQPESESGRKGLGIPLFRIVSVAGLALQSGLSTAVWHEPRGGGWWRQGRGTHRRSPRHTRPWPGLRELWASRREQNSGGGRNKIYKK